MKKFKLFLCCFAICFTGIVLCNIISSVISGIDDGKIAENIMNIPYIFLLTIAAGISLFLTLLLTKH